MDGISKPRLVRRRHSLADIASSPTPMSPTRPVRPCWYPGIGVDGASPASCRHVAMKRELRLPAGPQVYIALKLAAPEGAALFVSRRFPVAQPLMPHATAAWLVDNTSLTFEQIAEFCGLHILEVQAIADDTAATKLTGRDPIRAGELTHEEIEKGQADPDYRLQMHKAPDPVRRTKGPRYTPVSKRQDKPDGIAWIIRNHPEVSDGQISKLIGTTRTTIAAIRDRSHWNMANIHAQGPGDARPDHAARARRRGRQGAEGGRHARRRPTPASTATATR